VSQKAWLKGRAATRERACVQRGVVDYAATAEGIPVHMSMLAGISVMRTKAIPRRPNPTTGLIHLLRCIFYRTVSFVRIVVTKERRALERQIGSAAKKGPRERGECCLKRAKARDRKPGLPRQEQTDEIRCCDLLK